MTGRPGPGNCECCDNTTGDIMKEEYLVEITYQARGNKEVIEVKTDDLAWSMNQYQRNRLPLIWEIVEVEKLDKDLSLSN